MVPPSWFQNGSLILQQHLLRRPGRPCRVVLADLEARHDVGQLRLSSACRRRRTRRSSCTSGGTPGRGSLPRSSLSSYCTRSWISRKIFVLVAFWSLGKTWMTPCCVATKTRLLPSPAWVRTMGRSGFGLPVSVSLFQPVHFSLGNATAVCSGSGGLVHFAAGDGWPAPW